MSPVVAICTFRLGRNDGVSVVARTWMDALADFGFEVVTVTGEQAPPGQQEPHRLVTGLGLPRPGGPPVPEPDPQELRGALEGVDLVVVENLLTIPLNLDASRAVAQVLAGRPALLHHHDPPWQQEKYAHVTELPVDDPAWRHAAITPRLAEELSARGITATVVPNGFEVPDLSPEPWARLRRNMRRTLQVADDEPLLAHPVRAIRRKNVPAALALAEAVGGTYWLLGPAEEDYAPELDRVLDAARCRVVHRPAPTTASVYAAADHVLFPSTWEGFGNPPIEASLHRRTVSVGHYPVADDLRATGFSWFEPDDADAVRSVLDDPDDPELQVMLDKDRALAASGFSIARARAELKALLDAAGWLP